MWQLLFGSNSAQLLARSGEAVRAAAADPHVASDGTVVCGDASCSDLFSMRADDIFVAAILVKEAIRVVVADDDTVIVNTHERSVGLLVAIIQSCEASVAVDKTVPDSGWIRW